MHNDEIMLHIYVVRVVCVSNVYIYVPKPKKKIKSFFFLHENEFPITTTKHPLYIFLIIIMV
jgi:hypothetical protein